MYLGHKKRKWRKKIPRRVPRERQEKRMRLSLTVSNGTEKPQCVLYNVVLSAESLKPSKLKQHLETKHSNHVSKDLEFFRRHEAGLKRQRLDFTGSFQQENAALVQASYEVALKIAKNKKTHTIGESLIKPCLLKTIKILLEECSAAKMQ